MKRKLLLFVILGLFSTTLKAQSDGRIEPGWKNDSIQVLASMEILFVGFMPPPTEYEQRLIALSNLMYDASFEDLVKLLDHKSDYIKVCSYLALCNSYIEKIEKSHQDVYRSTTPIVIYSRLGNKTDMTAGEITEHYYKSVKANSTYANKLPKLKKAISDFIKKYAMFPATYVGCGFSGLQEPYEGLRVDHAFVLKNKQGTVDTVKFNFVVNNRYEMQAIEPTWTGTVSAFPPKISDWLTEYGRELNSKDSLDLNFKWK
jgi:hypothetical protein